MEFIRIMTRAVGGMQIAKKGIQIQIYIHTNTSTNTDTNTNTILVEFMGIMTKVVGSITGCRRFLPRTELCIWLTQLAAQAQEHDDDDDDDNVDHDHGDHCDDESDFSL